MNYKTILNEIRPNQDEKDKIESLAEKAIKIIEEKAIEDNLKVKVYLTGSISKGTWLSGNADIDIFITFPLEVSMQELKERGLRLANYCNTVLNGKSFKHYASHPYLNIYVGDYSIDIVPAYDIENSNQLKSAVDRTTLHTKYIIKKLKENQKDEVLLLKKFMKEIKVYGSDFKTGGFAGYLAELLIIKYGSFKNTLTSASNWRENTIIDIKEYETSHLFKDKLIVIDPTDKNRNVAASVTYDKLSEFITGSRNFILNPKEEYFYPLKRLSKSKDDFLTIFKERQTKTIAIYFNIPNISIDNIYPQLKKTTDSLKEKLDEIGFIVTGTAYWSDEEEIAILLIELDSWVLGKYEKNIGPKIWYKKACQHFLSIHKDAFLENSYLVKKKERKYTSPEEFIHFVFKENNINILKIGKNLKEDIVDYKLCDIKNLKIEILDNEDFLNHLDDYLNPSQHLKR
ncbi:MAG: CCA tRNA nucleotidyltransferase [Methanobrevibacter sp.]|jgi:tRNA nucleotidyltransferase (CCA-adding enzyme)|nr:CCA tRNA nucleotidyltransferase [Methanobrevibacter sp.]